MMCTRVFLFFSFLLSTPVCLVLFGLKNLWAGRSLVKEGRSLEKKVGVNTEG
jgi:hypothetical protein